MQSIRTQNVLIDAVHIPRMVADRVCDDVARDPKAHLDQRITGLKLFHATPRQLMDSAPPSHWRPHARARWFRELRHLVIHEVVKQIHFENTIIAENLLRRSQR